MPEVLLVPFTVEAAAAVFEDRRAPDWAAGYPTDGDIKMATLLTAGTKRPADDAFPWSVYTTVLPTSGLVVGGAGFHGEPDEQGDVEIGYGIAEEYRGQGVATAAVTLLIEIARAHGARRVVAGTDPDNTPSQRVLVKAGFVRTDDEGEEWRWALDLTT